MGANGVSNEENNNVDDVLNGGNGATGDGASAGGADNASGEGKHDGGENKSGGKMFTQEQVNKMMTREKNQGRSAVYKELGIDPKDEKTVAMVKALIESQKSDERKQLENEAQENAKLAEANQRALVAEAKAEAMQLGVKAQYVDDIVTLALAKLTDDSDMKTVIGEFKTKYPVWFGNESGDEGANGGKGKADNKGGKTGMQGTGASISDQNSNKGGAKKGLGARLAAQRKGSASNKSYWS